MRLLGVLARLLLALAYVSAAIVQMQAHACPAVTPASHDHARPDHAGGAAGPKHVDCGRDSTAEHPPHARDDCRTLCCFAAVRLPAPASASRTVAFSSSVRYVSGAEPVASRATPPEPGVPRELA